MDRLADATDFDFSDWLTGVEDLQDQTPEQLWHGLALPNASIPAFNDIEDASGQVSPWEPAKWKKFAESGAGIPFGPRWHQLVGITKMCELAIKGKSLLLMDQVGVGKTLQIVGTIVMYPFLRAYYKKHGEFPPRFSKFIYYLLPHIVLTVYIVTEGISTGPDGNLPDRPHLVVVPASLFDQWEQEFKRYVKYGSIDLYPYRGTWSQAARQKIWESVYTLRDKNQTLSHKVILCAYAVSSVIFLY